MFQIDPFNISYYQKLHQLERKLRLSTPKEQKTAFPKVTLASDDGRTYGAIMMADGRETSVKIILDIYNAISTIRKVQHSKSSKQKIFNYLKKLDKDVNHDYFMINLENLIGKKYVEVQEHGEQESLFLIKPFELFLSYGVEKVSSESQTEELNKSPSRDEIVEGKKKETELAELEKFF